jgi:hypothetical protein
MDETSFIHGDSGGEVNISGGIVSVNVRKKSRELMPNSECLPRYGTYKGSVNGNKR